MKTGLIRMGVVLILSGVLVAALLATLQQSAVAANPGAPPEPGAAAPRDLRVTAFFTDGFSVAWAPVTLTLPAGEYRWQVTERPAGPPVAQGATADLQTATFTVHGLQPGHTYYIEVRTWVAGGSPGGSLSRAATLVAVTLDSRTVLVAVYFAADNDLAPYIPLIGERLRAGAANNPNARVLYFADGAEDGDTRIWLIAHGVMTPTDLVASAWGATELDSADPTVLGWFLRTAREQTQAATNIAAILGHGVALAPELAYIPATAPGEPPAAPVPGIPALPQGLDYTPGDVTDGGYLSTADLGAALALATADGAAPFDVVFFDQCFQGNLDVLYEVRNAAEVFVASPNYAWLVAPYALYLPHFAPATAPDAIADAIIHIYQALLTNQNPNAIFYVRSADLPAIAAAVDGLGDALGQALAAGEVAPIRLAAEQSKYVDTTQCGRGYLHLGQPDELMGAGSFARILAAQFAPGDAFGVNAAASAVLASLDQVTNTFRIGHPYIEPTELWDYNDKLTILAPLPRNASPAVAWRASIYRGDAPFAAVWTPDPSQQLVVTQTFAYVREGRWDEFIGAWFTAPMTPTVGQWCSYAPPGMVMTDTVAALAVTTTVAGNRLHLAWAPAADLEPALYQIYARRPNGINRELVAVLEADARSYDFTMPTSGPYELIVAAVDAYGAALAVSDGLPAQNGARLYLPVVTRE
jgi:hypothetical protein